MILREFSRILAEELGARLVAQGEDSRPVRGLAVDEATNGWLAGDEVAAPGLLGEVSVSSAVAAARAAVVTARQGRPALSDLHVGMQPAAPAK